MSILEVLLLHLNHLPFLLLLGRWDIQVFVFEILESPAEVLDLLLVVLEVVLAVDQVGAYRFHHNQMECTNGKHNGVVAYHL